MIEKDTDATDFVYIVLDGKVDHMMYKSDTRMYIVVQTFRSGEACGDASIQKQKMDPLKALSKD